MSDYLAVIAIDFGTTFSGYAFSMRSTKHDIRMNKNWGAVAGFQGYKTPTTVLLRPDGSLQSFGFQAETDFLDLDEEDIAGGYLLFQRFKMELFTHKKLDSKLKIKSTNGTEILALDIFAKALGFIKTHSLEATSKLLTRKLTENDIRWVITVPAIWSDTAKKFMRLAAHQAGLVEDILSQNLIIALEPEAASLYCRTLALDKFMGKEDVEGTIAMKPCETYMIVDCGGGTIDITIHRVTEDGKIEEVNCASGGPWGGTCIDRQYYQLLDEIFGTDFMSTLKQNNPGTWQGMVVDFETKKRSTNPKSGSSINLTISIQFAKMFEKHSEEDVLERIKKKTHLGVKFNSGMLHLTGDTIKKMYSDLIQEIRNHIEKLLSDTNGNTVSKMFVVGAFAESAYLQECLTTTFSATMDVLIPEEAGMCIMRGAVLFGYDTTTITSRIARFHYCTLRYYQFEQDKHDPARKVIIENKERVGVLVRLICRGQRIKVDEVVEYECRAGTTKCTTFYSSLYCSEDDTTDDPGYLAVTLLEALMYESQNASNPNRIHKFLLRFGGTDILMKAIDADAGNEACTIVKI